MLTYSGTSTVSVFYSRPAVLNAQLTRRIGRNMNNRSHAIPKGSPWFYMEDQEETLFTITSISVIPTLCAIGLPCAVEANRIFQDLASINLEVHLKNGQSAKTTAVKDNMCDSASLEQEGHPICPPQKGPAAMTARLELAQGWVMEAIQFLTLNSMRLFLNRCNKQIAQ